MQSFNLKAGLTGGLVGGLLFGAMMGYMGMLPMIGKMVGSPTVLAGLIAHLAISAVIGVSFAVLFGGAVRSWKDGLGYGAGYGVAWWFLGPLTMMPLFMGMGLGTNWNLAAAGQMLPSLVGHLVFGVTLGVTFAGLRRGADDARVRPSACAARQPGR